MYFKYDIMLKIRTNSLMNKHTIKTYGKNAFLKMKQQHMLVIMIFIYQNIHTEKKQKHRATSKVCCDFEEY